MAEIISFRVVKEPYGWAVRLGEGMMTPFRSQALALQHASVIAEALRRRGEFAEVVVEDFASPDSDSVASASRGWIYRRATSQDGRLL